MDDKFTVLHGMEHTAVVILYVLLWRCHTQ
jgi:hypothetical protein